MDTKTGRTAIRVWAVALLAGAAIGLAGCQTPAPGAQVAPASDTQHAPGVRAPEGYRGQPADRYEEELQRQIARGMQPSPNCLDHTVVEHPDGGYHLVCTQLRD